MDQGNLNLIVQEQIRDELKCLFEKNPTKCLKQNNSHWGSNERILFVENDRLYYTKLYEGFREGVTKDVPLNHRKSFIELADIYEVEYLPKDKNKMKTLCISFPEKKLQLMRQFILSKIPTKAKTQQKSKQGDKDQKADIISKWVFHFDFDLKEKLSALMQAKKEQQRKKNQIQNSPQHIDPQMMANEAPQVQQQKQLTKDEEEISLQKYVHQIKKAMQFLKVKQAKQKMERDERKKKKPRLNLNPQNITTNQQQQNYAIQSYWRYHFKTLQELCSKNNQEKNIFQNEISALKELSDFKKQCCDIFQRYIHQKIDGNDPQKFKFEDFYFYQGIWIKLGDKQLNNEFLMYYYLSDIIYALKDTSKVIYRVPNMCLIQYLGFKGLCMCQMPFSEMQKSEIYNLNSDSFDMHGTILLKQQLDQFQKVLNIKVQKAVKGKKKSDAPLGKDLRIFQYNIKKDLKVDQQILKNFVYLMNIKDLFPLDYNFQVPEINMNCKLRPQLLNDFRQMLIMQGEDNVQLLASAFMESSLSQDVKSKQDSKVIRASKFIENYKIPQFCHKLNQMQLIIIDSYSLKQYLSEFGINVRYIYKVYELSGLRYVREVIEVEAISRTIKKLFKKALKDLAQQYHIQKKPKSNFNPKPNPNSNLNPQPNLNPNTDPNFNTNTNLNINPNSDLNLNPSLNPNTNLNFNSNHKMTQNDFQPHVLDFLNLVFGKGQQTDMFWQIIIKQARIYFKIQVKYPFEGSRGYLLHSVLYNCGIDAQYDINVPLFQVQNPFNIKNRVTMKIKAKGYEYPSFQIQKLVRNSPYIQKTPENIVQLFKDQQEAQSAQKRENQLAMRLYKIELVKNLYLHFNQQPYQATFSKMNLCRQKLIKPCILNPHHPSEISFYIANKSEANFQKGLKLLQFTYSDFHPIYISFYQDYAKCYQPSLLKKTAVLQSIKCFGEFHKRTTQLYNKFYNQGQKLYFIKSLRGSQVIPCYNSIKDLFHKKRYSTCVELCLRQIKYEEQGPTQVKSQNVQIFIKSLFMGMNAASLTRNFKECLFISSSISEYLNSFKIRNPVYHLDLTFEMMKWSFIQSVQKRFLYKIAILCILIRKRFNQKMNTDKQGFVLPAAGQERQKLSTGLINEYTTHKTHAAWINYILKHLVSSIQYFNHLEDLFNNLQYHIERYDNEIFKECLGFYDVLVRLYGQRVFKKYLYDFGYI